MLNIQKHELVEYLADGSLDKYHKIEELITSRSNDPNAKLVSMEDIKKVSLCNKLMVRRESSRLHQLPSTIHLGKLIEFFPHFSYGLPKIIKKNSLLCDRVKYSLKIKYYRSFGSSKTVEELVNEYNESGRISMYGNLFFSEELSPQIYFDELICHLVTQGVSPERVAYASKLDIKDIQKII